MYAETVGVEGKSGLGKLVGMNSVSTVATCSCTRTVKMWICSVHKSILRYVDVDLFVFSFLCAQYGVVQMEGGH